MEVNSKLREIATESRKAILEITVRMLLRTLYIPSLIRLTLKRTVHMWNRHLLCRPSVPAPRPRPLIRNTAQTEIPLLPNPKALKLKHGEAFVGALVQKHFPSQ